jgi:hypothetical protein
MMRSQLVWPGLSEPVDPYAQSWPVGDAGWEDYLESGGTLNRETYLKEASRWFTLLARVRRGGGIEREELAFLAQRLRISMERTVDAQGPLALETVPTTAEMARLAADYMPAVGMDGVHTFLGPWEHRLDPVNPNHRRVMLGAMAASLFVPPDYRAKRASNYWLRSKPGGCPKLRESIARLGQIPLMFWSVQEVNEEGVWVQDEVGVHKNHLPTGPVAFPGLQQELLSGWHFMGRIAPTPNGWVACNVFGFPWKPELQSVQSCVSLLLYETRTYFRAACVEHALRWRGQELARWIMEGLFLHTDEVPVCS